MTEVSRCIQPMENLQGCISPAVRSLLGVDSEGAKEVIREMGTERGPRAREEFSARGRMGRRSRTALGSPRFSRDQLLSSKKIPISER